MMAKWLQNMIEDLNRTLMATEEFHNESQDEVDREVFGKLTDKLKELCRITVDLEFELMRRPCFTEGEEYRRYAEEFVGYLEWAARLTKQARERKDFGSFANHKDKDNTAMYCRHYQERIEGFVTAMQEADETRKAMTNTDIADFCVEHTGDAPALPR